MTNGCDFDLHFLPTILLFFRFQVTPEAEARVCFFVVEEQEKGRARCGGGGDD